MLTYDVLLDRYKEGVSPALLPAEQPANGEGVSCECHHVSTTAHANLFGTCSGCGLVLDGFEDIAKAFEAKREVH